MSLRSSSADQHGREARHDRAAVGRCVTEPRRWGATHLDGAGADRDDVGRAHADRHVADAGGGYATDEYRGLPWREHRAADMRHDASHLGADVHIGDAGGGGSHGFGDGLAIVASGQGS